MNVAVDWESRNSLDYSEWMLSHQIFQKVCQIRCFSEIDLFTYCLSHQICCMETQSSESCNWCILTELDTQISVCFSSILLDFKSSQLKTQRESSKADIINPSRDNTSLISNNFEHVNQESFFAVLKKRPSEKSQRESHPLVKNTTLQLVAWTVSRLEYRRRGFQRQLRTLSLNQVDQF